MDPFSIFAEFGLFDWIGLLLLVVGWPIYDFVADSARLRTPDFTRAISKFRAEWMRRAVLREVRIADTNLIAILTRTVGLFASTTMFILAGVMALLGASETGYEVTRSLPFAAHTSLAFWQAKALAIAGVFVYAFVTLVWCLWQWNACAVMLGAAPTEADARALEDYGERAGALANYAGEHFNKALRSYYYALALLAWFVRPELFAAGVAAAIWLQYRRDFRSRTFRTLNRPRVAEDARAPETP